MEFKDLQPFSAEMADMYDSYLKKSKTRLADACFNSRIAWEPGYFYKWTVLGDCLVSVSDGGIFTSPHAFLPLGELRQDNLQLIVDRLRDLFAQEGWPLEFLFIDDCYKDLFSQLKGYQQTWSYNDDYSDYVYDAEDLRTLRGRTYRNKRNHVNKFLREYFGWTYKRLEATDAAGALELTRAWCMDKEVDCKDIRYSDLPAIKNLFDNFDRLQIVGGAIYMADELIAFSMGSQPTPDYGVIHFEKAHPDYEGLYTVINQLVMQEEFPDISLVNREEDMGIEGMRQAKESYFPVERLHKNKLLLSAD